MGGAFAVKRQTMYKQIFLVVGLVFAIGLPVQVGADQTQENRMFIMTPEGPVPQGAAPAGANQVECGGTAPDETYCTTELHVAQEVWAVAVGASFTYTGTLEVRLFHATSVLVMQVHVIDGWPVGFNLYGQFPVSPAVFWHECHSYALGEAGEDPMPLPYQANGTPGGSGLWDCFVLYP